MSNSSHGHLNAGTEWSLMIAEQLRLQCLDPSALCKPRLPCADEEQINPALPVDMLLR